MQAYQLNHEVKPFSGLINPLQHNDNYKYPTFLKLKLCILNTVYLCGPYTLRINSDFFLKNINRLIFVTEMECVFCEIGTKY
jgi:hypothetical protein